MLCTFSSNESRALYVYFSRPTWMKENIHKMYPGATAVTSESARSIVPRSINTSNAPIVLNDDPTITDMKEKFVGGPGITIPSIDGRLFENVHSKEEASDVLTLHLFFDWARCVFSSCRVSFFFFNQKKKG
jgi:hypothetical protein